MRPLEILIPTLLVIYLLWKHPRPQWVHLLPAGSLTITLLHFLIEGYRWQMLPLYGLSTLLALGSLTKKKDLKPSASYLIFGLVALAILLPTLLPIPRIPTPSGPYQVGTRSLEMIDTARTELYSGIQEPRRYMIQIWYPAQVKDTDPQAPWMENAEIFAPAIATYIDLPNYFLNHLAHTYIPAYSKAQPATPVEETGFPIILFSHGWNGFNAQNAGQALELASRGYVVIGLQHTYGAVITVFPDGTIAPNNPNALPQRGDDPNYEETARLLADQWARDMAHTLDFLSSENPNNPLQGKLNHQLVGVYGHSTGGGAAIQFCGTDPRCKALLGMDPFMRPVSAQAINNGVTQPTFFMFSQEWAEDTNTPSSNLFFKFLPNAGQNFGVIYIEGTKHFDFSDLPLFSPIAPQLGLKGPLNGKRVTEIVNTYLIDFFEQTLRQTPSSIFKTPPYSEVHVIR